MEVQQLVWPVHSLLNFDCLLAVKTQSEWVELLITSFEFIYKVICVWVICIICYNVIFVWLFKFGGCSLLKGCMAKARRKKKKNLTKTDPAVNLQLYSNVIIYENPTFPSWSGKIGLDMLRERWEGGDGLLIVRCQPSIGAHWQQRMLIEGHRATARISQAHSTNRALFASWHGSLCPFLVNRIRPAYCWLSRITYTPHCMCSMLARQFGYKSNMFFPPCHLWI